MPTAIEWTHLPGYIGETLNPSKGCDWASKGCDNCYARAEAPWLKRLHAGLGTGYYQVDGDPRTSGPGFGFTMHPEILDKPFVKGWTKPRCVFFNSTSDLFHRLATEEFIVASYAMMALRPRDLWLVLTKQHTRMAQWLTTPGRADTVRQAAEARRMRLLADDRLSSSQRKALGGWRWPGWPVPNIWPGVSVEDPDAARRLRWLVRVPAARRFISAEPLLGPLDLRPWLDQLDWVITGGESGQRARPAHPDWFRSIRDQCVEGGVPFLFKQWGVHVEVPAGDARPGDLLIPPDGQCSQWTPQTIPTAGQAIVRRVDGKHAAGRVLDGRVWHQHP